MMSNEPIPLHITLQVGDRPVGRLNLSLSPQEYRRLCEPAGRESDELKEQVMVEVRVVALKRLGDLKATWDLCDAIEEEISRLPLFAAPAGEAEDPMQCECATWGRELMTAGHHYHCERFDPKPFIKAIVKLLDGMEHWSADEDGVHPDAWEAYKEGCKLTCRSVKEGHEVPPPAAVEQKPEREDCQMMLRELAATARDAVEYIGSHNYAHREAEALQSIRDKLAELQERASRDER
jgi:hypothetical protein